MTFAEKETSAQSGETYHLYQITAGNAAWYYTNAETLVNYSGNVYAPLTIEHGEIPTQLDSDDGNVAVRLPYDLDVCNLLKFGSVGNAVMVDIFQGHADETEHVRLWRGRVVNYKLTPPVVELTVESSLSLARRLASTLVISSACPVPLYEDGTCDINKEDWRINATISSVSGLNIISSDFDAHPDNWFMGGFITWQHPTIDVLLTAHILEHVGDTIRVSLPPYTLSTGTIVAAYPGCNKSFSGDCLSKFGNTINFRGHPFINNRNPFAGYSVF